jgi:hypothetical protein
MTITKDGRLVLDTSRKAMNLVPSAAITLTSQAISFPDLLKGTIYHKYRYTPIFGPDEFGCSSFTGLIAQEWGPLESGGFLLSDTVLGTVPAGTDYLDVMVNLTNTVVPGGWFDLAMRTNFPSGEWCKLEGGSCLIEGFPGLKRLFEIVLDGTDVKLRRYQSVTTGGQVQRVGSFGTGNASGFVAGTSAPTASGKYALYGKLIQVRGPSASGSDASYNPGGGNSCSQSGPSYASTWTGDIVITPGRISA